MIGVSMENSGRVPDYRNLTDRECLVLERLIQHGTPASKAYAERWSNVMVISRCSCGCPTIDLAVSGAAASLGSTSTILAEAGGVSPEGVKFGIILHARESLISELEVYPIDGDGVFALPEIDDIDFYHFS